MTLTLAAWAFAAFIAVDTLRTVVPLWSPLPWFDEWANPSLLHSWQDGEMTTAQVLLTQHGEHRLAVPRLFFFADYLLAHGSGIFLLVCIFAVQTLHAGVFAAVLGRARPRAVGRWAIAAVILAMMFSLRQEENLSSGFQLQFVGVFAGATLTFTLFAMAVGRARTSGVLGWPLPASMGVALLTTFTMANGLIAAWILVVLAGAARMHARVLMLYVIWAAIITTVYLWNYEAPTRPDLQPTNIITHALEILLYAAAYLGNIITGKYVNTAAVLGIVGMLLTAVAAVRAARHRNSPPAVLAMFGVMLFVGATATITATGRAGYGFLQALSSRYSTGSVAFWSAQLVYWSVALLDGSRRYRLFLPPMPSLVRVGVTTLAAVLCFAVINQQADGRFSMVVQNFLQNESSNLLMLDLNDSVIIERTAWFDEDVRGLLPVLKENDLSIFGTADYAGIGRPVTARAPLGLPCSGAVEAAVADLALGPNGVRVSGRALNDQRIVRRVLLADDADRVVGLASGPTLGGPRGAWRGFAVATLGAVLTAYGLVDGPRLCRIGEAVITPGPGTTAVR